MHTGSKVLPARRPKLVFTEQFYYPEGWAGAQLPRDITIDLERSGYDVEVICGRDQYVPVSDSSAEDPASEGVKIRRVPGLFGGTARRFRLLRQLWFYLAVAPLLLFRRSPDLFLAQTNPPLGIVLVALAAKLHRRPYVVIAMDLYPEVLFAHELLAADSAAGRLLQALFSWAYRHATRIVALGPVMKNRLVEKGVSEERVDVISNWATGDTSVVRGDENQMLHEWSLRGFTVILYSGNLGVSHDVETPVLALEKALAEAPDLRLVFIGAGSGLAAVKALVEQRGLSRHVLFFPLVPTERLPESLGLAHAALVTLKPGFSGLVVPSKLLGYMARGIPSIFVGPDSDAQQLIDASGGGAAFPNEDIDKLSAFMVRCAAEPASLAVMGESAKAYYDSHLAREKGLAKYRELVASVTGDTHR